MRNKAESLEWEGRWAPLAGLAALVGVALVVASAFVIGGVSGDGDAELLRSAHEHSSAVTSASVLQAVGFLLLVAPLVVLFRAAAARSLRMRYQLIGLVVAAPLFLAVAALLNGASTNDAASEFVAGNAKPGITAKAAGEDCRSELDEVGAEEFGEEFGGSGAPALRRCTETRVADEEASNAVSDASLHDAAIGFGFGGRIGLAIALFYTCLHAMRVGLLTRFWGSLGMALGVAALLLLVQFSMIFFIYLGFLLLAKVPGGRPPAWAVGEAIPWPTPGEKAAASLEPTDPQDASEPPALDNGDAADDQQSPQAGPDGERRKRKQRD
ncbi:MAG TPA: hypothetical protein VFR04_02020 [Solirubrobacterales bacterium]|nr:hypothetical protein [Solirubrobacterales bacterium]